MYSQDVHEKYMDDIRKQIEEADREIKEKARLALKEMSDNYCKALGEKVEEELDMSRLERTRGNIAKSDQHKLRAEIFKSALDAAKAR